MIECFPLTPDRWPDLERLFGPIGACAGCWCMSWRVPRRVFEKQKGDANRAAFHQVVQDGPPPGVLAYDQGQPVGWCSIAPRETFPHLANSRILAPVDDQPVWSITCLFVLKGHRRKGVSRALIEAAASFARDQGARIVEAYPTEASKKQTDVFVWTGLASAFLKAGFHEVARRSPTRPIMRC